MTRYLTPLLTVLILFTALSVEAKKTVSLEDQFFDNTDIEQFIEDFPVLVNHGLEIQRRKVSFSRHFPASQLPKLKLRIASVKVDQYKDQAHKKLTSQFTQADMQEIVKWQKSGFGKRVQRLQKFSHTVDGMDQMKSFFQRQNPVTTLRLDNVKKLAKKMREVHLLINIAAQTQTAIQVGLDTISRDKPRSFKAIFKRTRKAALQRQAEAKAFIHADLIYTFRTFLPRDLNKLLQFAESDLGHRYFTARQKVITEVIVSMNKTLAKEMRSLVVADKAAEGAATKVDPQTAFQAKFNDGKTLYKSQRYKEAFRIFQSIAQQGHIKAQYYLGKMYQNGHHVGRDEVDAYAWYSVAGNQGNSTAKNLANGILSGLSIVETSKAGKRARQYIKDHHANSAEKRRAAQKKQEEEARYAAELAENKKRLQRQRALSTVSDEEKRRRKKLQKRSAKHRQLLIERYPVPELMSVAPTILTE